MNYTLNFSGASVFCLNHTTSPDSLLSNIIIRPILKDLFVFQWFHVLVSFNHLLVTANSSFNFLIYFSSCHARKNGKANGIISYVWYSTKKFFGIKRGINKLLNKIFKYSALN